jgi:hypothetical protein
VRGVKRLSGEMHWRDIHVRRIDLVSQVSFIHLLVWLNQTNEADQINQIDQMIKTDAPGRQAGFSASY